MLRVERHPLGPRLYVLGLRIHEVAVGLAVLGVLLAGGVAELWEITWAVAGVTGFGSWLVLKDWRDLIPSKRNTSSWSPGLHRVRT